MHQLDGRTNLEGQVGIVASRVVLRRLGLGSARPAQSVACTQNSPTSRNGTDIEEYPHVKRDGTHSKSDGVSTILGGSCSGDSNVGRCVNSEIAQAPARQAPGDRRNEVTHSGLLQESKLLLHDLRDRCVRKQEAELGTQPLHDDGDLAPGRRCWQDRLHDASVHDASYAPATVDRMASSTVVKTAASPIAWMNPYLRSNACAATPTFATTRATCRPCSSAASPFSASPPV